MRLTLVGLLFLLTLPIMMLAQSKDEAEVKAVIASLFDGMRTSDSAKVKSAFAPGAIMQTIKINAQGEPVIISDNPDGFIQSIANQPKGSLDEQITFGAFFSDGQLATVATPYKFYYKGTFSHCGVNAFQLVKFTDGWKIQYIIDTRRKTGCD